MRFPWRSRPTLTGLANINIDNIAKHDVKEWLFKLKRNMYRKSAPRTDIDTESVGRQPIFTRINQRTIRFGCKRRDARVIRDDDDKCDDVVLVKVPNNESLMEETNPVLAYA